MWMLTQPVCGKEKMMNFEDMKVGDKIKLPPGKWGDEQRAVYDEANQFAAEHPGVQFETEGHEGSNFETGQYWLVRTK